MLRTVGAAMQQQRGRRDASERAKKLRASAYARSTLIALSVAATLLAVGFLNRDAGVRHWLDLRRDVVAAKSRIAQIEARIAAREAEAEALRSDPLATEGAIRADLRLARPGEWVVRDEGLTNLRNP